MKFRSQIEISWAITYSSSAISWKERVEFQWDDDDDVCFVLNLHAYLGVYFNSDNSLKKQSAGRHINLTPVKDQ